MELSLLQFFEDTSTLKHLWSFVASPVIVCAFIVLLGLWSAVRHLFPLTTIRRRLNRFLEATESHTRLQPTEVDDLENHFREAGLHRLWGEYRHRRAASPDGTVANPLDIFTTDAILSQFTNRHRAELIPGRLTALGVLGTFIGLTWGLHNLDIATDHGVKSSIEILMEGMGTAFWSSIVGIVTSIVWATLDRSQLYKTEQVISQFQHRLQTLLPYEEPHNVLRRLADDQREHLENFKTFASDVLIPGLVQGFVDAVQPHFQQTAALVQRLGDQSVETQTHALNQMVTQFVEKFTTAFGGQMTELAETMKQLTEWQKVTKQELTELVHDIRAQAERQQEILQHSNGVLVGVTQLSSNLFEQLQHFQSTMESVQRSAQSTAEEFGSIAERVERANDLAVAELEKVIEAQQVSQAALRQLSDELRQQADRLERLTVHTNQQVGRLSELLQQEIQAAIDHIHGGLETTFRSYDDSLAQATTRLREVVHTLYESVRDLPDEANRIAGAIQALRETLNHIADEVQQWQDVGTPPSVQQDPELVVERTSDG